MIRFTKLFKTGVVRHKGYFIPSCTINILATLVNHPVYNSKAAIWPLIIRISKSSRGIPYGLLYGFQTRGILKIFIYLRVMTHTNVKRSLCSTTIWCNFVFRPLKISLKREKKTYHDNLMLSICHFIFKCYTTRNNNAKFKTLNIIISKGPFYDYLWNVVL